MRYKLFVYFLLIILFSCEHSKTEDRQTTNNLPDSIVNFQKDSTLKSSNSVGDNKSLDRSSDGENKHITDSIYSKTFLTEIGWGYDIFIKDKKYIHQPHIPGVSGLNGFKTETDARQVAELMIYKIENNILPPSVSLEDLDSLHILITQ